MLDEAQLASVLLALLTGGATQAEEILQDADLDDSQRHLLTDAIVGSKRPTEQLTNLGKALITTGHGRDQANEAYRAAFYVSPQWQEYLNDPLFTLFTANKAGHLLDKWIHYFPIYTRYLSAYRNRPVRILEIGVYRGGSIRMWTRFFGPQAHFVGMDVDPVAIECAQGEYTVFLGDQSSVDDLRRVHEEHGPFDVIIDDGGHTMEQQIVSVETLFPLLAEGGTYLVEDCHTSYWDSYGGGRDREGTFIEWTKDRIDDVHGYHFPGTVEGIHPVWTETLDAIHIHDSVVVLEKLSRFAPFSEQAGGGEFAVLGRPASAVISELTATRQTIAAERDRLREERAQLERLAEDLRFARADVGSLRDYLDDQERELHGAQASADQAQEQMRWMRQSLSWRVTAPLRAIRRRL